MKAKISVTLSRKVLNGIDRVAGSRQSRSALIETVLLQFLRERRDKRDVEIINRHAEKLNRDAKDGLEDQASRDWYAPRR